MKRLPLMQPKTRSSTLSRAFQGAGRRSERTTAGRFSRRGSILPCAAPLMPSHRALLGSLPSLVRIMHPLIITKTPAASEASARPSHAHHHPDSTQLSPSGELPSSYTSPCSSPRSQPAAASPASPGSHPPGSHRDALPASPRSYSSHGGDTSYASAGGSPNVDVPEDILNSIRHLERMLGRIKSSYLEELGQPQEVIDAAYDQVMREQDPTNPFPEGKVVAKYHGQGQPASFIWAGGAPLPHDHPWNLRAISSAARDVYTARGLSFEYLVSAEPAYHQYWGRDINRDCLPDIVPHPHAPQLTQEPRNAKALERELKAFKWMYAAVRPTYGYAHFHALRLHDAGTYAIVKELAEAVSLSNVIMNVTCSSNHREALQRCARAREDARRGRFRH